MAEIDESNRSDYQSQSMVISFFIIAMLLVLIIPYIIQMYENGSQSLNNDNVIFHLFSQLASGENNSSRLPFFMTSSQPLSTSSFSQATSNNNIKLEISSPREIHGIAGQFIRINGSLTNLNPRQPFLGGIAYISLVDNSLKVPVDLEDWSAEKGLYIPSMNITQPIPLEWNVRLVKVGSYSVDILFNKGDSYYMPPIISSRILMEVAPKLNLNPGNVLPIAFGVPAVLMGLLGIINYIRGKKTGVYS
jgi:hypothetical protein